ncbi:MAG: extracellular metalloproteinase [Chloroflexi bacterium]|nr:extracellular metalloproteinase [Chloroflexota bacterium]MCI0578176.1 extracellular metalloproteinase [Chloroflexota bacterium]MCI0649157.1 extracellular metalloproteinase [Chloroflexota bacterium]MCI0725352.1 extracellular metalloproteinase [Chloroflexota bacterium]
MNRSKHLVQAGLMAGLLLVASLILAGPAGAGNQPEANSGDPTGGTTPRVPGAFLTGPNSGGPLDIALAYIHDNREALGLTEADLADVVINYQYASQHNGVTHIYLRQRYQGIEVFGGDLNINIAQDGNVINLGNRFVSDMASQANSVNPALTAIQAVEAAAGYLGYQITEPLVVEEATGGPDMGVILSTGGISLESIPARLVYQPDGNAARLAWDIGIYALGVEYYWSMRIDAQTGRVLSQHDLVVHDHWDEVEGTVAHVPAVGPAGTVAASAPPAQSLNPDSYRVYAMPSEYPDDGPRVLEVDPALDGTSSLFGWHDTNGVAGVEYTITRGNNVHAYGDTDNNNLPDPIPGAEPDGGTGLVFDFPLELTMQPSTYLTASITNLFYWNNIIHDVFWEYGFDEVSGNFQVMNYNTGMGLGNDDVRAEGQDGAGLNNANFFTPIDGQQPRMQMYLWNQTSPMRDGDLENSIIVHEYGHGISNRLTGGPLNVSCLNNSEQMGEGWSDWLALVLTAKNTDVDTTLRGIGTYVLGQPTNGTGIRPAPYTTDMGVNNYTYGDIPSLPIPHGVGFVWASMLWEVYWNLTNEHGFNSDFYANWSTGGNNLAIQLVMDGMKLQPCSPGFVDGRDAILAADTALTGGQNQCLIWEGFAKRGLGFSASQGSPNSTTDGTEAFDIPSFCEFLTYSPATVEVTTTLGAVVTSTLTVSNTGTVSFTFSTSESVPWVSVNPVGGTVGPGGSIVLDVVFDSTAAGGPGDYSTNLTFSGDFGNTVEPATLLLHVVAPTDVSLSSFGASRPVTLALVWLALLPAVVGLGWLTLRRRRQS